MDLWEKYKDRRAEFEILAFHDPSVSSLPDLDERLGVLQAKVWKGRVPGFPILLDATGETIRRYGIHAFPTSVLLDPKGHVVETDGGEMWLERQLGEASPGAVRLFDELLRAGPEEFAGVAARIGASGSDDALFALERFARESLTPETARSLLGALGKFSSRWAWGAISRGIASDDARIRLAAVAGASEFAGSEWQEKEVRRTLKDLAAGDADASVRKAARNALAARQPSGGASSIR